MRNFASTIEELTLKLNNINDPKITLKKLLFSNAEGEKI